MSCDVLHDGQWLTPAEYAKVKGQEPPAEPVKNPPKENPPPKEPVKPKAITDGVFNGSAQGFKSTVAVDVVTHASITSRAVMAAVKDALGSAKQKP